MLGGGGNPSAWWEIDGDARRRTTAAARPRRPTTLAQGNDYVGVAIATARRRAGRCVVGPDRDHLELGGRLRARLPGRRPAAVVAARLRRGRALVAHVRHAVDHTRATGAAEPLVTAAGSVVHGHFYQPPGWIRSAAPCRPTPPRRRLATGTPGSAPSATGPTRELGNSGTMSWDLGPTLAAWMESGDPVAYRGFVAGDARRNGMAQPFHHAIMPLAVRARPAHGDPLGPARLRAALRPAGPTGMWLPETAVDLATLRMLAEDGVASHDPRAVAGAADDLDTRRPVRIDLGDGRSMSWRCLRRAVSAAVSFEPDATVDADGSCAIASCRGSRSRAPPR